MARKGTFVAVEGADGVGKTTLCAKLVERLQARGVPTLATFEPTRGQLGLLALECEDKAERALLFAADRRNHYRTVIEPALLSGRVVVCDRYALSGVVYGIAAGLPGRWMVDLEKSVSWPDLTVILDLDSSVPAAESTLSAADPRGRLDRDSDLQTRVRELYRDAQLAQKMGCRESTTARLTRRANTSPGSPAGWVLEQLPEWLR